MDVTKAAMARQRMIIGCCCCNVDTLLHRLPVQQQVITVTPASFTFLQPLAPPKQAVLVDGAFRLITTPPFVLVFCF